MAEEDVEARELELVEQALASGQSTAVENPRERELQELVLALRDAGPAPAAPFVAGLDRRVEHGFGDRDGWRARLKRASTGDRRLAGGLVAATSVLAALVVAASTLDGGPGAPPTTMEAPQGGGGSAVAPGAESAGRAAAADEAGRDRMLIDPPPPGRLPTKGGRDVERTAAVELAAPNDRLERVGAQVAEVATRRGGFVLSASLSTGDRGRAGGTYVLRVPARELTPTLDDLSRLASVRSRSQDEQDITARVDSAADRLAAARAERRGLLRRLERVRTVAEAEGLRRRIDLVSAEIRDRSRALNAVRRRADFSTITVTLTESRAAAGALERAWGDARKLFVAIVGLGVRALGLLVPLALIAASAAAAAGVARRRRREAVLGA